MTAFETTNQNIQKILDVINSGKYTAKTQIARAMGVSPTLVNNLLKRIEPEIYVVDKVYHTNCTKVEETEFYKKFSVIIPVLLADPSITFWQNKHISSIFDLSTREVQVLRAYVDDIIYTDELLQRRNGDEKI